MPSPASNLKKSVTAADNASGDGGAKKAKKAKKVAAKRKAAKRKNKRVRELLGDCWLIAHLCLLWHPALHT
jgi:hypothetical protein